MAISAERTYPGPAQDPALALVAPPKLFVGQPFTLADAAAAQVTEKMLRRMRSSGVVRTVLRGVFVDASVKDSLDVRATALSRVAPAGSVLTDRTAAWLHGADIVGPSAQGASPPVDAFRIAGDTRLRRDGCRSGTRTFVGRDLVAVGGLWATTPLRTALDLGRLLRRPDALAAMDALMAVGGVMRVDLATELPRFKGARGVVQLRQLVALADARAESPAESRTRLLIVDDGLPAPEVQWEVRNYLGVLIYRLDLAYPEVKLAVEYDGLEFHTSASDRAHDEARRDHLRSLGWTILVLTKDDVYGREPAAASMVAAALDRLGALPR